MKDDKKTKAQLMHELAELRQQLAAVQASKASGEQTEVALPLDEAERERRRRDARQAMQRHPDLAADALDVGALAVSDARDERGRAAESRRGDRAIEGAAAETPRGAELVARDVSDG